MTTARLPAGLSVWLLPAGNETKGWQQLIDCLAVQHHTDPFAPHVTAATLGLNLAKPGHMRADQVLDGAIDCLQSVAGEFGPLTLPVSLPGIGQTYFQCVFCRLATRPVAAIGQSLLASMNSKGLPLGNPVIPTRPTQDAHLSLIYGEMGAAARTAIARSIRRPGESVTLDGICLVSPGKNQSDFSRPAEWEIIANTKLTGTRVEHKRTVS